MTFLLAHGGAVTVADIEEAVRDGQRTVAGDVTESPSPLLDTAATLGSVSVLQEPDPHKPATSVRETVDGLLQAHRDYVEQDPDRFVAIANLASAAIFGRRDLLTPLAQRSRRTRATAFMHLAKLSDAGLTRQTPEQLLTTANLLIDGATGIELGHQIAHDRQSRDAAYRELSAAVQDRLTVDREKA